MPIRSFRWNQLNATDPGLIGKGMGPKGEKVRGAGLRN